MPQRTAAIESLPMAVEIVKAMQADGLEWGEGYRPLGRQALTEIIQGRMTEAVDYWLDSLDGSAMRDRRNGFYPRYLLSELGDIELSVPRTRRFCPTEVLKSYARRAPEIDRAILAGFVLGLSTRKVGEVLLALLGRPVSASTVSRVAKTLDAAVTAFHALPLKGAPTRHSCSTAWCCPGRPAPARSSAPSLWRLCIRADGRKEIVDFRLAASESATQWERFLTDLYRRGLTADGLEMICADGGQGLIAALPTVYPGIPLQRCWAHKIRNVLDKVRKVDRDAVKAHLHAIMNAPNRPRALSAARGFADAWEETYPRAVACLRNDLDDLLTCFRYPTLAERRQVRTTNAIERRFREVRRRTRPMGTFQDRTSMDRILFAVFIHENKAQGASTPFSLTHNS